jgi:integrase
MATERIHGPYQHGKRWRVVEVRADGTRAVASFESEAEARAYIKAAQRVAVGRTLGEAVREYLDHLRAVPGRGGMPRREATVDLARQRLVGMLGLPGEDGPLLSLTKARARRLFDARAAEVKPDTLLSELACAHRWAAYWMAKGGLSADPFAGLVVLGERSAGKPQLRVDEARRFLAAALNEGTQGGLAAALALLTGLRATEVTGLQVRDLDDQGRILWVADNAVRRLKTRKGRRLEVPSVLVPRLLELADGKGPEDRLWYDPGCPRGVHRHWLYNHVERLCAVAGVPKVSPHGLRGTWATLATAALPTEQVAAALGHLPSVSRTNYIAPGAEASAASARLEGLLGTPDRETVPSPSPPELTDWN